LLKYLYSFINWYMKYLSVILDVIYFRCRLKTTHNLNYTSRNLGGTKLKKNYVLGVCEQKVDYHWPIYDTALTSYVVWQMSTIRWETQNDRIRVWLWEVVMVRGVNKTVSSDNRKDACTWLNLVLMSFLHRKGNKSQQYWVELDVLLTSGFNFLLWQLPVLLVVCQLGIRKHATSVSSRCAIAVCQRNHPVSRISHRKRAFSS
jgi:hypothetical protein